MIRRVHLAYKLPRGWEPAEVDPGGGIELVAANAENVGRLFADNDKRRRTFLRHLARGYEGVFVHDGDTWVTYAWMSTPETPGPPSEPVSIRRMKVFWVFYCRTAEPFRGRGFYRLALQTLAQRALARSVEGGVYVSTVAGNVPSRRAILRAGFEECGTINTYRLPWLSFVWGRWHKDREHPNMEARVGGARQ